RAEVKGSHRNRADAGPGSRHKSVYQPSCSKPPIQKTNQSRRGNRKMPRGIERKGLCEKHPPCSVDSVSPESSDQDSVKNPDPRVNQSDSLPRTVQTAEPVPKFFHNLLTVSGFRDINSVLKYMVGVSAASGIGVLPPLLVECPDSMQPGECRA